MAIYPFEDKVPFVAPSAYVHPEATIIGEVTIGEGCYIGPGHACAATSGLLLLAQARTCRTTASCTAWPRTFR